MHWKLLWKFNTLQLKPVISLDIFQIKGLFLGTFYTHSLIFIENRKIKLYHEDSMKIEFEHFFQSINDSCGTESNNATNQYFGR